MLDAATHKVIASVPFSPDALRPMGVVVTPDGAGRWSPPGAAAPCDAIDTATNTLAGSVAVGERPWGLAVSPDGTLAFTANGPSNDVSFVDLATMTVVAKVPVGDRPWGLALVPGPGAGSTTK